MIKLNFRRGSAFASKKAIQYTQDMNPLEIRNITVIRHAAIGDMVVMRPVLIEMKKFFPNAHITLSVISNYSYGIPKDLVDSVHIVDKTKNNKKTTVLARYKQIKQLPSQDIIFDMADTSLSLLINLFVKSSLNVGFTYRAFKRFFYDINTLRSDFVLETESMMHQLNVFGANTQYFPYEYKVSDKTTNTQEPYIIYFAGASTKDKCWNEENYVKLMEKMLIKYPQYKHVVLQGIGDDEKFDNIYNPFKDNKNVIHQKALPLENIYDYLAEATLLVSADTGIRNMAVATHTSTVGIMLAIGASPLRYFPRLDIHRVVYNLDFTQPDVESVFTNCIALLEKSIK